MSIAQKLVATLLQKNFTFAVAESCTGGLLGATVTDIAGSSAVFMGGVVAYDNLVKAKVLRISDQTLTSPGAVSEKCALEMAVNIKALLNTSTSIAITGIAGPSGGTRRKPVGTVIIAATTDNKESVQTYHFSGDRGGVRRQSVEEAMKQLLTLLS